MAQELKLEFDNNKLVPFLFGEHNAHLSHLEKKLGISIADRGNQLTISGPQSSLDIAENILSSLWEDLAADRDISMADIDARIKFFDKTEAEKSKKNGKKASAGSDVIKTQKKSIKARSPNQEKYLKAIETHEMVFGLGPAGTGKTYLAVAAGVSMYLEGKVERLIFCRPALEAGENLGFLPGDMKEKVDPYLRPIYDALQDMLPLDVIKKKMEAGEIEIAPLAFMRGRTLSHAFVILDEAQNTTCSQMKMFLTRMGEYSRMVITGDITQTDLPKGIKSGLRDAVELLQNEKDIPFIEFTKKDVTRHHLVEKIIHAYDTQRHGQDG